MLTVCLNYHVCRGVGRSSSKAEKSLFPAFFVQATVAQGCFPLPVPPCPQNQFQLDTKANQITGKPGLLYWPLWLLQPPNYFCFPIYISIACAGLHGCVTWGCSDSWEEGALGKALFAQQTTKAFSQQKSQLQMHSRLDPWSDVFSSSLLLTFSEGYTISDRIQ